MSSTAGNTEKPTAEPVYPEQMMLPIQQAEMEMERGLRFTHMMMQVGQIQGLESLTSITALTQVLIEKGIISDEEITEAHQRVRPVIEEIPRPQVRMNDMGDKYEEGQSVEIDCHNRIHLCHARCCSLPFFLTVQDIEEGVARWDYGNPYFIKRGADGYCTHCDPETRGCTIHAKRPHVCRLYDCRNDKRIWIDFEKRIPAPFDDPSPVLPIAMAERIVHGKPSNGVAQSSSNGSDGGVGVASADEQNLATTKQE